VEKNHEILHFPCTHAQSFDLRNRATTRRILRFVLLAVIIGLGVNVLFSLLVDRGQYFASLARCAWSISPSRFCCS